MEYTLLKENGPLENYKASSERVSLCHVKDSLPGRRRMGAPSYTTHFQGPVNII